MPEFNNTEKDNTLSSEITTELQITPFITRDIINTIGYINDTDPYNIYAELIYMQRCKCQEGGIQFTTIDVDGEEVMFLPENNHRFLEPNHNREKTSIYIDTIDKQFEEYLENGTLLTHKQIFIKITNNFYLKSYLSNTLQEEINRLTEVLNLDRLKNIDIVEKISNGKNNKTLEELENETLKLITSNTPVSYQESVNNLLDYYTLKTIHILSKFNTLEEAIEEVKTEDPEYDYLLELLEEIVINQ